MTDQPALLVVTGASGAGKSTIVRELASRSLPGVGCHELDSIGVPSPEEMERRFGGGGGWQAWAVEQWIARLLRNEDGVEVAVLDGQTAAHVVREAFERMGVRVGGVVLVDCEHEVRNARLCGPRCQPELATPRMDCWAAYLRGQCDALALPRIDTSRGTVADAADELAALVEELAARRRAILKT